jgi:hypothetical protein
MKNPFSDAPPQWLVILMCAGFILWGLIHLH